MKSTARILLLIIAALGAFIPASAQMVKINAPAALAGCPNFGYEHQLTPRLSAAGDLLWLPYKWGHDHEVFRSLQLAGELRYYFDEASGERLAAGWYLGAYAMYGDFNIGLKRDNAQGDPSYRRQGWGVSAGVSGGWKHRFSSHWQMDINLGVGYAHLQYHKYRLDDPQALRIGTWHTRPWVGPVRFSISFGYVFDCGCVKE